VVHDPVRFNLFDDVVYSKGAWVLHTLRGVVGDSVFFCSLARYRARFGGGNATSADFQAVVDSVAGVPMEWFFQQWVYGKGWPVYGVQHRWTGDSFVVTLAQEQPTSWPLFTMPLALKIHGPARDTTVTVLNTSRKQSFTFALPFVPDSVTLDPGGWVLKHVNKRTTAVAESATPERYVLEQNYPNPFNASTTIRYSLPAGMQGTRYSADVTLTVFDLLGREVRRIVAEQMPSLIHCCQRRLFQRDLLLSTSGRRWRETRTMVLIK
jgi:hypothetical protein